MVFISACGVSDSASEVQGQKGVSFSAAKTIQCKFADDVKIAYTPIGSLGRDNRLQVKKTTGGMRDREAGDINSNPVKPDKKAKALSYEIDALDGDPDYGDMFELTLPVALNTWKISVTIASTYWSGEATPSDFAKGTCVVHLQNQEKTATIVLSFSPLNT